MIPKIIHQTGPADKTRWHPLWNVCQKSWKENHKNFKYKFWNDDANEQLVKNHYPQYYDSYKNFALDIIRIDFARFCILHKYGGIYVDMDMYCYKNFYDEIKKDICIVQALAEDEVLQNSMMISVPNNSFWIDCMELSINTYNTYKDHQWYSTEDNTKDCFIIREIAGPILLSNVYDKYNKDQIQVLPAETFNNTKFSYNENYRTKHMLTGMWGANEMMKDIKQETMSFEYFMNHGFFPEVFDARQNY